VRNLVVVVVLVVTMFSIPSDSILQLTLVLIVLLLLYDIAAHDDGSKRTRSTQPKKRRDIKRRRRKAVINPAIDRRVRMDIGNHGPVNIMNVYMPQNNVIVDKYISRSIDNSPTTFVGQEAAESRVSINASIRDSSMSISGGVCNAASDFIDDSAQRTRFQLTLVPYLPGCEETSPAAQEMKKLFPEDSIIDILRFLIARKGDVSLAADMFRKAKAWHLKNLPLRRSPQLDAVLGLKCFFFHKTARDGTPILYFRGAIYDQKKASAETYILTAAHCIDYVLKKSNQISVTVFVHSAAVPGASNSNPDMDFIKGFSSALSDNFPERMKRLILWPMPWYAFHHNHNSSTNTSTSYTN